MKDMLENRKVTLENRIKDNATKLQQFQNTVFQLNQNMLLDQGRLMEIEELLKTTEGAE